MRIKRICTLLVAVTLCAVSLSAFAEVDLSNYSITDATVQAAEHMDITAPCSGTLTAFDLEPGDAVTGGETLFSYVVNNVYSPVDGTLTELFVAVGEPCSYALQNYGMLGSVAPGIEQRMNCSTAGAHDDAGEVYVGQTLYFKSTKGDKDECCGRVLSRSGETFVLEILKGTCEKDERLTLYETSARKSKENVGKGVVVHADPFALSGNGVVCAVYAEAGQAVKKGDKILSLLGGDAEPDTGADIVSPENAVVERVAVTPGQQVWKGELLCRLLLTDSLEIVADVDEMDLNGLKAGDEVYVTVDTNAGAVLQGTVTEISSLGVTKANAAYYTVHVSLANASGLKLGQSASLYLTRE